MKRGDWLALAAVIAVAVAVRVAYFLTVHKELWFTHPIIDSLNYHEWALNILRGDILGHDVFVHSPLYAFFLAAIYALVGPVPTLAAAVQLGLGALTCGLLFLLGRRLFSRWVGILAGLSQALYGIAFFHEGTLLTVVLIHLLNILLLLAAYWAASQKHWRAWVLPGVLLGLSVLTRPNILIFFFVLALWIWMLARQGGPKPWLRAFAVPAAVVGISMFVVILPATIRNYVVLHEFMLTVGHGGLNFYIGNNRQSLGYHRPVKELGLSATRQVMIFRKEAEKRLGRPLTYSESSRFWFREAWREIENDPAHWQRLLIDKLLLLLNYYEYTTSLNYYAIRAITPFLKLPWLPFGVLAPLALLGMVLARRRWRELLLLYGLVLVYAFSNLSMLVSSEYRFGLMPAFFLFAGLGLETLARRLWARQWHELWLPVTFLAIFSVVCNLDVIGQEGRDYHLATAHSNFGGLLARLEYYQQASEEYGMAKDILSYEPSHKSWLAQLQGDMLMKAGNFVPALAALHEAYSLAPEDADVANSYANALTANGNFDEAVEIRKEAIRLAPHSSQYQMNLGITYLWAKQDREAEKAFAAALALEPRLAKEIEAHRRNILQERERKRKVPYGTKKSQSEMELENLPPNWQPPAYTPPPIQYQPPPVQYQQYQPPPQPYQPPPR